MLTRCTPLTAECPVGPAARDVLRDLANRHGLGAVRWWPSHPPLEADGSPPGPESDGDLVVEGLPFSLRQLRADLEQVLGRRVAVYLADCLADETRERLLAETVSLC